MAGASLVIEEHAIEMGESETLQSALEMVAEAVASWYSCSCRGGIVWLGDSRKVEIKCGENFRGWFNQANRGFESHGVHVFNIL